MGRVATAERREKLAGRSLKNKAVTLTPAPAAARLSVRADEDAVNSVARALGVTLPQKPKASAASKDGSRVALWLGPDEWLVIAPGDIDLAGLAAKAKAPHSAVDVSHRNVAIMVEGPGAEACLAAGCPQDLALSAFPVGACSRTILGKIEIVLLRTGENSFRVECWRSFADYAWAFLADAAQDAG